MARPAFQPTDKQRAEVKALVAFGIVERDIASYIGCNVDTLRKYFEQELAIGAVEANAAVAKRLYQKAVKDGDTACLIWWTKARMRWRETRVEEITGKDGGAVQIDVAKLSDDELAAIVGAGSGAGSKSRR